MSRPITNIKVLTTSEAETEYSVLWETYSHYLPGLTHDQRAVAISIAVGTCPYCHEDTRDCQCWNDE